jgi:hypothetical protein
MLITFIIASSSSRAEREAREKIAPVDQRKRPVLLSKEIRNLLK